MARSWSLLKAPAVVTSGTPTNLRYGRPVFLLVYNPLGPVKQAAILEASQIMRVKAGDKEIPVVLP